MFRTRQSVGWIAPMALALVGLALAGCSDNREESSLTGPRTPKPSFQILPGSGTWTTRTPEPSACCFASAVISGNLYLVNNLSFGGPVIVYNPVTDAWATGAGMPTAAAAEFGAATIAGKLYIAGGCAPGCSAPHNTLQVYDPATDHWATKTPMPTARFESAAGAIGGKFYVVGGAPCDHLGCPPFATLEAYDPATDTWATKAPMPTARLRAGAAVINGKLYVAGGQTDQTSVNGSAALEVYDPATDTWATKTPMPTGRISIGVGEVNGILYAVGGWTGSGPGVVNTVEAYDPATDSWTSLAPIPTARFSTQPQGINGVLYVVGGNAAEGGGLVTVSTNEAFTPAPTAGNFSEFPIPTASVPFGITAGPDGAIWFTEQGGTIGRITTGGVITEFSVPTAGSVPLNIAAGPDDALWFAEQGSNAIGRITTTGAITEFAVPTAGAFPLSITAGADGALWFTEQFGNQIGRITTAGVITEFVIPTPASRPLGIAAGPDGALWFAEFNGNQIGRITTGGAITEFTIPTASSGPFGITAGPDAALWFTESAPLDGAAVPHGNTIGRITIAGVITEFTTPTASSGPFGITAGPDAALWFTEYPANQIGRITTAGVITEFPVSTASSGPSAIIAGPDGALWFNESGANKIGRITVPAPTKTDQAITFGTLSNRTFGDPLFTISASASSGLPVSFSASGSCTVSGSTVSLTGVGSCTITADQGGDDHFNPAPSVQQTFSVLYNTAVGHGFLQPINTPPQGQSVFKIGSTIPVKFQLFLADSVTPVSTAVATIQVNRVSNSVPSNVNETVTSTVPNQGITFRYDVVSQQYIFNLGTKGWTSGTYQITALLNDGSNITVNVGAR